MLLMIDNYDSFTFNLVHYFQQLGQQVVTIRNDEISVSQVANLAPDYIVISPGPGDPDGAGISLEIIKAFAGKIPLLGVCLGHQSIAQCYGGLVKRARKVMHGKTSSVRHTQKGLFQQLDNPLTVTRYHSLIVDIAQLPKELEITAWTETTTGEIDEIMALQHKSLAIYSVQFHPESILTQQGLELLENFLISKRAD
ncbi:aminodeoxychorismate/anthranilate synthase component II [Thalassotalea litorea]|uniref:Aminodeoxychorismate/anthranilate synthase component II n=1 Tax=Thalassotalea litorea TaxID=2020715 RepID=A0A5R9IHZ5_9GAMM|nr:aminodeoxychorismate/anthranilate synthase component II [Thalassotalea litorea]TLU59957.1 aminodeoxychorismate/anthranilate synthase component II [Thalassotalea litorea]